MTHNELNNRIRLIRPGAMYMLIGNTYGGLMWLDTLQEKPSLEELGLE